MYLVLLQLDWYRPSHRVKPVSMSNVIIFVIEPFILVIMTRGSGIMVDEDALLRKPVVY
jgi:hypothetical protein